MIINQMRKLIDSFNCPVKMMKRCKHNGKTLDNKYRCSWSRMKRLEIYFYLSEVLMMGGAIVHFVSDQFWSAYDQLWHSYLTNGQVRDIKCKRQNFDTLLNFDWNLSRPCLVVYCYAIVLHCFAPLYHHYSNAFWIWAGKARKITPKTVNYCQNVHITTKCLR